MTPIIRIPERSECPHVDDVSQVDGHWDRNSLELRVYDSTERQPASSGELFAAYRAIAEVTKSELERLNEELQGGVE